MLTRRRRNRCHNVFVPLTEQLLIRALGAIGAVCEHQGGLRFFG
jgi:hypothetical protein